MTERGLPDGLADPGADEPRPRRDKAASGSARRWLVILLTAAVGTLIALGTTFLLPQRAQATAVIGLRSTAVKPGVVPVTPDELKQLAQQEAVTSGSPDHLRNVAGGADMVGGAKPAASVDPDSATLRVSVTGVTPGQAMRLANALSRDAHTRLSKDARVEAAILALATRESVTNTPRRWVVFSAVEAAAMGLTVLVWAKGRRR